MAFSWEEWTGEVDMVTEEMRNLEEITCDKKPLPPIHMKSNSLLINQRKKSFQKTSPIKAILTNLPNSKYIARLEQSLTTKFKWHSRKFLPTDNTRYYSPEPYHPDSFLKHPSLPEQPSSSHTYLRHIFYMKCRSKLFT